MLDRFIENIIKVWINLHDTVFILNFLHNIIAINFHLFKTVTIALGLNQNKIVMVFAPKLIIQILEL